MTPRSITRLERALVIVGMLLIVIAIGSLDVRAGVFVLGVFAVLSGTELPHR